MKTVPVQEALGMVLRHDVTRIVPGEFKGRALKKGHIINEEDIPALLNMGKEHVYAFDLKPGYVHEDEAAARIARAAAGNGILFTEPSEGRVNLKAGVFGLLKVNAGALQRINEIEEIVFATMHTNQSVTKKQAVAGTRIVPLVTGEDKIKKSKIFAASIIRLLKSDLSNIIRSELLQPVVKCSTEGLKTNSGRWCETNSLSWAAL